MTLPPSQPPTCSGCPLYGVGKGFVLGSGNPKTAKYAIILEAPGSQEVQFQLRPAAGRQFYSSSADCEREISIRKRDYPEMDSRYIKTGVPVVGPSGNVLFNWILWKAGLHRDDAFIDNTIRCLAPKSKTGAAYPTGETKKAAELHCRQYDRIGEFKPNTALVSLHPAGLLREITPLPLAIKDFEKVRDFLTSGRRTVVLLGGKAASAFLGYASNVTKWRGHYAALAADWSDTYKQRFAFTKKTRKKKKVDTDVQVPA